jgi:DNA processing protein
MNTDSPAAATETAEPNISTGVTEQNLVYWLKLRHIPGLGNVSARQLLDAFTRIEHIFSASHDQLRKAGLNASQIRALESFDQPSDNKDLQADTQVDMQADIDWLQQPAHHIVTIQDPLYPQAMRDLADAPILLYVRGDPEYLSRPQLAMVGSRNPTAAGRATAREFAMHLSQTGITITSGLAAGIDGAAHTGALQGIAGTIAVVAHGLDIIYPASHQQLARQISESGAIISEMPLGTKPLPGLFPRRNRLISAMSLGTLVVEAAKNSGSLITARYAMEQNREVFAIPGSIHNPMARGCHQLIRDGAKLVETANDILEEISALLPGAKENSSQNKVETATEHGHDDTDSGADGRLALDPDHQKLLKCLAYEPASIDELVDRSGFKAAEVASMLLILELQGTIVCQDGRYTRIE